MGALRGFNFLLCLPCFAALRDAAPVAFSHQSDIWRLLRRTQRFKRSAPARSHQPSCPPSAARSTPSTCSREQTNTIGQSLAAATGRSHVRGRCCQELAGKAPAQSCIPAARRTKSPALVLPRPQESTSANPLLRHARKFHRRHSIPPAHIYAKTTSQRRISAPRQCVCGALDCSRRGRLAVRAQRPQRTSRLLTNHVRV